MEKFIVVGSRLAEMQIDEAVLKANVNDVPDGHEAEANVKIEVIAPEVSNSKYRDREVIEIGMVVRMHFVAPAAKRGKKAADSPDGFRMKFFAGFVGKDVDDDGKVSLFEEDVPQYQRMLYWMKRDFIVQVLAQSLYRVVPFPHDLEEQGDSTAEKVKIRKRSTSKKKVGATK